MCNFLGLDKEFSSLKNSKVVVLQVPYDATTTYQSGARNGPRAILDASTQVELFDEELCQETYKIGIYTRDALDIRVSSPEDMVRDVQEAVKDVLDNGKFPISLGGEHTITLGALWALKEKYSDISVVQLDAHADLRDQYNGSKYSHACVARRIKEKFSLFQIGIRSLCREEQEYIDAVQLKSVRARDVLEKDVVEEDIIPCLSQRVYITIDLDIFDSSVMPSVGTPEPGGLGWYDVLRILRNLSTSKEIVGFDVVELAPIPGNIAPDFLSAKLIYRLLGYVFR